MRIALVTTSFPLSRTSSAGVFIQRLAVALAKHSQVTVLTPDSSDTDSCDSHKPYELRVFRYAPKRYQKLTQVAGGIPDALHRRDPACIFLVTLLPLLFINALVVARKVDLIHGNWSIPSAIAALAGRIVGTPSVSTLRGEDYTRARSSRLFRFMLKVSLRLNIYTICVSEAMTDGLRKMLPQHAHKVRFIPNGVAGYPIQQKPFPNGRIRLLTIGSCIERKRQDLILEAISDPSLRGHFILRVVGEGPLQSRLTQLAEEMDITDQLELVGAVPPEDIFRHLEWANVFILSSESEGRPNALMEAMAGGLPVVASDIDGIRELLAGDSGLLFESGSANQLKQCLGTLMQYPEMAIELGNRAKQRIDDLNLTWSKCSTEYTNLYRTIISC